MQFSADLLQFATVNMYMIIHLNGAKLNLASERMKQMGITFCQRKQLGILTTNQNLQKHQEMDEWEIQFKKILMKRNIV